MWNDNMNNEVEESNDVSGGVFWVYMNLIRGRGGWGIGLRGRRGEDERGGVRRII